MTPRTPASQVGGSQLSGALFAVAVFGYVGRPWSVSAAQSRFDPSDLSYANFDRHGYDAGLGWWTAMLFAVPMLWLAWQVFGKRASFGLFGRARDFRTTALSLLIAIPIALPTQGQVSYLMHLPIDVTMPVAVSAVVWPVVVEAGRTAAVRGAPLGPRALRTAIALAVLALISKLAMLGFAMLSL